jgi:hypothetical protein
MDDWELKLPPYLGGFGFTCNPDMDYELTILDEISNSEVSIISNILESNKLFMDNLVFHEKNKVDISEYVEEENLFVTEHLEKDSLEYRAIREISRFERQMQLNKSLNEVSLYSLRRNTRDRHLSRFNYNRSNIKNTVRINNHISKWDLMNDIINFNKDYLGELNFAIPKFIVKQERPLDPSLEPGSLAIDKPNVYSRQDRLESILYNKGLMKIEPKVRLVSEFSEAIGNIRRSTFYSYFGKIPQWSEEIIQQGKDDWFCFLYLNANPEFAFLDYVCRNKATPICDSVASDIITRELYFDRFYSIEDSFILYDLREEKVEFSSKLLYKKLRRVNKHDPKRCAALVSFYKLNKKRIKDFEYAKDAYTRLIDRVIDLLEEKTLPLDNENLYDEAFYNFKLSNLVDFKIEDEEVTHNPEFITTTDDVEILKSNIDFSMFEDLQPQDFEDGEYDDVPEPELISTQPDQEDQVEGGFSFGFEIDDSFDPFAQDQDENEQGDLPEEDLNELYGEFAMDYNPDDYLEEDENEGTNSDITVSDHSIYYDAYDEAYEDIRMLFE